MELTFIVCVLMSIGAVTTSCKVNKPNVVFIIADDLGWNDVSFHGSDQVLTPNIDLLAYSGVALGRYYSHAICTPSRTAFLTGKYAYRTGMQGFPLPMSEDRGIPLNETLLPEYFKKAGYATHLVGKWHVGSSRNEYLPTARGFDTHFGHRGGYIDYYEYTVEETFGSVGHVSGFSLYRNLTPAWEVEGYITDVYTKEAVNIIEEHDTSSPLFLMVGHNAPHAGNEGSNLQVPPEVVKQMEHIELTSRRMFAAMVKKLDDSVGDIFSALFDKGILENTIVVFVSDNGGMTSGLFQNFASNYPMRGIKMSPFEGAVRVAGLLWAANLNNSDHFWDGYMHITDWMPTLLSASGIDVPLEIDGINQWQNINTNAASSRTEMYEIDDVANYSSIIYGQYKLVTGEVTPSYSNYQGADLRGIIGEAPSYIDVIQSSMVYEVLELLGRPFDIEDISLRNNTLIECNSIATSTCMPGNGTVCLYNIIEDPCETTDLAAEYPELVATMKSMLDTQVATRIPRIMPTYRDPMSAPRRFNYTWTPWL